MKIPSRFLFDGGLLVVFVAAAATKWNFSMFDNFVQGERLLLKCSPLLVNILFYLISPLFPKPRPVESPAAKPSTQEAVAMAIGTALLDYTLVGCLFVFWDTLLSGSTICPIAAACVAFAIPFVLPLKDEIQARILWPKFIARAKLNSSAYSWKLSVEHLFLQLPYYLSAFFSLVSFGFVEFQSIRSHPSVLLRVWAETMGAILLGDAFMCVVHRWMHTKRGYFLHKFHHNGKKNLSIGWGLYMGIVDGFCEIEIGLLMLLCCKAIAGCNTKIHFLTVMLRIIAGFQDHSMNPYAPFFFHPLLDYLLRPVVTHNLHHVVQHNYYTLIRWTNFSPGKRKKEIDLYNKHMKTHFPSNV